MLNVEDFLTDGKIKYKTWKKLTKEERNEIIEYINDEEISEDILSEIAPKNRKKILPEDYSELQLEWREKNNEPRIPSRESVDAAQQTMLMEFLKMQQQNNKLQQEIITKFEEMQKNNDPVKNQEVLLKMFSEYVSNVKTSSNYEDKFKDTYDSFLDQFVDKPYYIHEEDKYELYKQYDYKAGTVQNLLIQTKNNSVEEYFEAIKDILEYSREPVIYEFRESIYTISVNVLNPDSGRIEAYTFSSRMGTREVLYEIYRILLRDEDVEGSDKYLYIRKNINSITISSLNIKQLAGSDYVYPEENKYFRIFNYRNYSQKSKNVCFYKSLKYICESENIKSFIKMDYGKMREKIIGKELIYSDDFTFNLENVNKVFKLEELKNINLIILADEIPKIIPNDTSIKFEKYENIVRKFFLRLPILYSSKTFTKIKESQYLDYRPGFTRITIGKNCSYLEFNEYPSLKFYLMIYKDNHITNLESIEIPKYCSKCLSIKHTEKDLEREPFIKMECMNNILKLIPIEEFKKHMPKTIYISHDYETHVRNTIQFTHSVAFVIHDENNKFIEKKYMEGRHIQHSFIRYLRDKYPNHIKFLIGFNSSNFDNYFTLDALLNIYKKDIESGHGNVINKNKILSIKTNGFVLWDLYNFCKDSLSRSCKAYGIVGKKNTLIKEKVLHLIEKYSWDKSILKNDWSQIPHLAVTKLFEEYNYNKKIFHSDDWKSLQNEEYNLNDAEITMELFWKVRKEISDQTKKLLKKPIIKIKEKVSIEESILKDEKGRNYKEIKTYDIKKKHSIQKIYDHIALKQNIDSDYLKIKYELKKDDSGIFYVEIDKTEIIKSKNCKIDKDYENIYDNGLDIAKFITSSSLIYSFFDLKFTKLNYDKYNHIFEEVIGGRTQAFEKVHIKGERYGLIDINSSYPSIGIKYDMPDGEITECEELKKEDVYKIYLCLCNVMQRKLKINFCGSKSEEKPNDWTQDYVENIWLWKEEIEELEKHDVEIEKIKYLIWEDKTNQIGPVQEELKQKRILYKTKQKEKQKELENMFLEVLNKQDGLLYDFFMKIKNIMNTEIKNFEDLQLDKIYYQTYLFVKLYIETKNQDFEDTELNIFFEKYFYQMVIYKKMIEKESIEFEDLQLDKIYLKYYESLKKIINLEDLQKTIDEKIGYKVKEMITKLKSNGISGKCIEKNHDDVWKITSDRNTVVNWGKKYKDNTEFEVIGRGKFLLKGLNEHSETINKPRHWGARILSLGRLHLWKEMIKYSRVLYCDTDSSIVPYKEIKHEELDSKEYGKWDLEYDTRELYIISPKNYWLGDKKCSLKSYSDKDIWEARKKHYIDKELKSYYEESEETVVMFDIDEDDDKKYYFYRKNQVVAKGKGRCKELYDYLFRSDEFVVTTTFQRFTKRFVERAEDGGFEILNIHTEETVKILS
ncbi:hypothetical protein HDV06_001695 [Boothiomyces sp. JEL0866]|nr:hypothetical protein HDV06_001695 [Boothiomyces sp. JEL0866]